MQIDFTEGRLALKLDPSGGVLNAFIELNNRVLDRFNATERQRIGVHTAPAVTMTLRTVPMWITPYYLV